LAPPLRTWSPPATFAAQDGTRGFELWVTDGTANGTKLVKDINPGSAHSGPRDFCPIGKGKFLFAATDAAHGRELWITDGTPKGTKLVADILKGALSGVPSSVLKITPLGDGRAIFQATEGKFGEELWISDGTKKGTELLKDIRKGGESSALNSFTSLYDLP
jgi:ELWxxDGT repeat protein